MGGDQQTWQAMMRDRIMCGHSTFLEQFVNTKAVCEHEPDDDPVDGLMEIDGTKRRPGR